MSFFFVFTSKRSSPVNLSCLLLIYIYNVTLYVFSRVRVPTIIYSVTTCRKYNCWIEMSYIIREVHKKVKVVIIAIIYAAIIDKNYYNVPVRMEYLSPNIIVIIKCIDMRILEVILVYYKDLRS